MPPKRPHSTSVSSPAAKRPASALSTTVFNSRAAHTPNVKISIDETYGQRSFFPIDDAAADDESADEDSLAVMSYLSTVRTEARGLPSVFQTARERALPYDQDYRAGYADGAYVAAPQPTVAVPDLEDAEHVYHAQLLQRYAAHREQLERAPPREVLAGLDLTKYPAGWDSSGRRAAEVNRWLERFVTIAPHPAQLASMEAWLVFKLLGLLASRLKLSRLRDAEQGQCLGAWTWGLLSRVGDVGTCTSEEVSALREVGKTAARLARRVADEEEEGGQEDEEEEQHVPSDEWGRRRNSSSVEGDSDEEMGESESAVELAKAKLLAQVASGGVAVDEGEEAVDEDPKPKSGAREGHLELTQQDRVCGFLIMVLTIVGEAYGQRDLLPARSLLWM